MHVMTDSEHGLKGGMRKAIEGYVHHLVRQLISVNGRDAPEAGVRSARRRYAGELREFLKPDGIFRRSGDRSESPKQSLRFGPRTGVTETDEHAALPWRQVECGLKRIWRFGHEAAEK